MHEAQMHKQNSFVTLTYDDAHLPRRGSLDHRDFQLFMKRLRKNSGLKVRFFMGGEYGETNGRPHFHACLFGLDWPDKLYSHTTPAGAKLYNSKLLTETWGQGITSTGDVTFESAGYVARYCTQTVNGNMADEHYKRFDELGSYQLKPEYGKMSLKPGIGKTWFDKYHTDIYPHDHVIVKGKKATAPKYYDKLLERLDPDTYDDIKFMRETELALNAKDNTPERLAAKLEVKKAQMRYVKRTI